MRGFQSRRPVARSASTSCSSRLVDAGSLLVRDLAPDSGELDRQGVFDLTLVPGR